MSGETSQTAFRYRCAQSATGLSASSRRNFLSGPGQALRARPILPFADQDGMALALVGIADAENEPGFDNHDIPSEHRDCGFHGVTLLLGSAGKTAAILTDVRLPRGRP